MLIKLLLLLTVPKLDVLIVAEPEPAPNNVCVTPLPARLQLITLLFVAASAPAVVCNQTTALVTPAFVFVMVRSLEAAEAGQTVFAVAL